MSNLVIESSLIQRQDARAARQAGEALATGYIALPRISWLGGFLVTSYVAVLDIVLVFIVFKGDVRLS